MKNFLSVYDGCSVGATDGAEAPPGPQRNEFKTDIFISYARKDLKRVQPIVKELQKKGWSVFWDLEIPPGESWRSYIKKRLDESRCVLVLWSHFSITSEWVIAEADEADKRGILVPALLDAVEPPFGLSHIHAADLSDWKKDTSCRAFRELVNAVTSKIYSSKPALPGKAPDTVSAPVPKSAPVKVSSMSKLQPLRTRVEKGISAVAGLRTWQVISWKTLIIALLALAVVMVFILPKVISYTSKTVEIPKGQKILNDTESGNNEGNDLKILFADSFNNWDYNHWQNGTSNFSFYGRTQQRQLLPEGKNGVLRLELDTYNPINGSSPSFYGTEVISNQTFSPGVSVEIKAYFEKPLAAGIVGGMFLYNSTGTFHDEIDFTAVSNRPNQIQTNFYANEPLGAGHPAFNPISGALTDEHTYRIEWFKNAILWYVDGQLVREQTNAIPQHPMALHMNIWAPAADWPIAFNGALNPVTNPVANTAFFFNINSVRVAQLPKILSGTTQSRIKIQY
ncbi:TIR domain-containing protein [Pelodictyon phaeoclathratiforme]